jgi:hypothetical protein
MSDNKIEFTNDTWEYRVVRQKLTDGNEWLSMQEVYSDEDGKPYAHSVDLEVTGDSLSEIRKKLQSMLWAIDKDIVEEIQNDVMEDDMEKRMLSLEMENAEMRDRLEELGEQIKSIPNDMELGEKVRGL